MRHSPASARHKNEDILHLSALHDDELARLLVDHAKNPDGAFLRNLYYQKFDR